MATEESVNERCENKRERRHVTTITKINYRETMVPFIPVLYMSLQAHAPLHNLNRINAEQNGPWHPLNKDSNGKQW